MNRAERRKLGICQPPPKMKHIPEKSYQDAINRAYRQGVNVGYEKACNYAVGCMLAIPLLVLNDNFNEIRLKEFNGQSRVEHFFELCTEVFEEYNDGEDTLERLMRDVLEKTGFDLSERIVDGE